MRPLDMTKTTRSVPARSPGAMFPAMSRRRGRLRLVRRLSIPTRIFLGFAVVITAFGAVSISSVRQHDRTARLVRLLHDGYLPLAIRLGEAKSQQAVFRQQLARGLGAPTEARLWLNAARQLRPSTFDRLAIHIEGTERLASQAGDPDALRAVREAHEDIQHDIQASDALVEEILLSLDAGRDGAGLSAEVSALEAEIGRKYRDAYNLLQDRIGQISAQVAEQERQAALVLGVLALLSLGVGVAITFWSQRLLKPLPLLLERVAVVGRGDLSSRELPQSDDELGRLAADFEAMVAALSARDLRLEELRRMQRQIVEGLRAAVLVVDGTDVVRTVNLAAEEVLGLGGDTTGRTLKDALGDQLPEISAAVRAVRSTGEPESREGLRFGENRDRFVDVVITPFGKSSDGSVLVVADDVTLALATKSRLIHTERLAAIGRMAAHVTHEVRNPLSSIGLNVEMLEDELGDGDEEARALMRAIQEEIERLRGVTDEYLRLARLPQPHLDPEDLGALVAQIASFVKREMTAARIEFEVVLEDVPPVALDSPQMRQAILNLLRNAREAQPPGGRIRLSLRERDDEVILEVADEGAGIPEEERERIFDLFYTTKELGTGLGLPLTQQIVAAHGGTIVCEAPATGEGTVFRIVLPVPAEG